MRASAAQGPARSLGSAVAGARPAAAQTAAAQAGQFGAAHLFAEHMHGAAGRERHGRTETQQCALAGAVGAEQGPVLTGLHGQ